MLIKDNTKMGTILGLFFFIFVMNSKFEVVKGAVYSSPDTAFRFAHCLIGKISESQFFTIEDRNSLMEVVNVMAEAMKHQYQTNISIKILVIAFITSMADVVIHEDPAKNTHRKGVYASSMEQCSLSSAGYVDVELIMEALRIIASIEHSKLSRRTETTEVKTYNSNRNIQQPKVFDPLAVQPSPVQIQRVLESFNPNGRTSFEQPNRPFNSYPPALNPGLNPQFKPSATSGFDSGSRPGMPLQVPNFSGFPSGINPGSMLPAASNTGFSMGSYAESMSQVAPQPGFSFGSNVGSGLPMATNKEFSAPSNAGSPLQQRNDKVVLPSSDSSQKQETKYSAGPPQAGFSSVGLNSPQTKESSVVVILPSGNKNVAQTEHFQNNPIQKSGEMGFQPTRLGNPPISQESITSSEYLPQTGEKTINSPSNPALERTIQDILIESELFRNAFNFDIPQEKAINLARSITEQSLKDYNLDLVTKAVAAVSEEVAKVRYQTPENYALALSNALVNILKLHNLPLYIDGSRIANNFLFNLDNAKKYSSESPNITEQSNTGTTVNPEEKPGDIDFESPPFAPEDTEGELFSEGLQKYLTRSNEFSNFFCNNDNPDERAKTLFPIIKLSLSEYGSQVSSFAASLVSAALSEQSTEGLCSNFVQIISDGISEAFDGSASVLEGANAQDISSKLISNLNLQIQNLKSSDNGSADQFPSEHSTAEPYDTMPTLQSSYASDENMTSVSFEVNYATSDLLTGQTQDADSAPRMLFTGPASPMFQMSPVEKPNPLSDDYAVPFTTTPYSTEESDDITNAITLTEVIIDLWEMSSTESSDTVWKSESDDAKDQESLASHLLESFESALGAFLDISGDILNPSNSSDTSLDAAETVDDSESDSASTNVKSRKRQRKQRRRGKKGTTISDVVTPSIIQTESESINNPHESTSEETPELDKSPDYHPDDSPNQQKDEHKFISEGIENPSSPSNDSSVKTDFVELQPSFQGPPSAETKLNQTMTPKFDADVFDSESKDSSILVANSVSQKASETIAYIRNGNFNMGELCARINEFAPIVNIPPLDYCIEIAAIDYLLNVLKSTIKITTNVN